MSKAPPPKWVLYLYVVVASLLGADIVYEMVRGDKFNLLGLVVFATFVVLAVETWRKRQRSD